MAYKLINSFAEFRSTVSAKCFFQEKNGHLEFFWLTVQDEYPKVVGKAVIVISRICKV